MPLLAAGGVVGGLSHAQWRPQMQTFLMRSGIEERDYVVEIPRWAELCTVVQADAEAEEDEAVALLLGASSISSSAHPTAAALSLSTAQLKAKKSVSERLSRARKAYSLLYAALSVDLRQLVADVPQGYAFGVWSFLEKRFRNTEQDSVMALWKEFTTLVQENEENFDAYKARVDCARELLVNAKQKVPEGLYTSLLLWNLQPRYSTAVLTLKTGDRLKDPTTIVWSSIVDYMAQYERSQVHLGEIGLSNHERGFAASADTRKPKSGVTCFNCNKKGHFASECDMPDRRKGQYDKRQTEKERRTRFSDESDSSGSANSSEDESARKTRRCNFARRQGQSKATAATSDEEEENTLQRSYMCRAMAGSGLQSGISPQKSVPLKHKGLSQSVSQTAPDATGRRQKRNRSEETKQANTACAVEKRLRPLQIVARGEAKAADGQARYFAGSKSMGLSSGCRKLPKRGLVETQIELD